MRRLESGILLVATVIALDACAAGEKGAPAQDTATLPGAAGATVADTTQPTRLPEPRVAGIDTARGLLRGFYKVVVISSSQQLRDTLIEQRIRATTGWVHALSLDLGDSASAPELVVRADSLPAAPMVAYVDFVGEADGGWRDVYVAKDSALHGGLERLGDDDYGIAALGVKGSWAQVVYAYTSSGEARIGWIRLIPCKVEYTTEQQQLDE